MGFVDVAGEVAQEPFEHVRGTCEGDRHPVVVHVQECEFVEVLVHDVGEVDEQVAPAVDRQRHPDPLRFSR